MAHSQAALKLKEVARIQLIERSPQGLASNSVRKTVQRIMYCSSVPKKQTTDPFPDSFLLLMERNQPMTARYISHIPFSRDERQLVAERNFQSFPHNLNVFPLCDLSKTSCFHESFFLLQHLISLRHFCFFKLFSVDFYNTLYIVHCSGNVEKVKSERCVLIFSFKVVVKY